MVLGESRLKSSSWKWHKHSSTMDVVPLQSPSIQKFAGIARELRPFCYKYRSQKILKGMASRWASIGGYPAEETCGRGVD